VLNVNVDEPNNPVQGDRVQLQQVIINLVMNAVQSLSTGRAKGRTVWVHVRRHPSGHIELLVRDNGAGIPEHLLVDIFSPFFTTKTTGMGMGLSICRSIIDTHAGKIWAANDPSGGAIVGFQLPVYETVKRIVFPNASMT
jgi:C4-dicarboxylate-specific signal transduction histidine kinase